jgi:hypothetical protein
LKRALTSKETKEGEGFDGVDFIADSGVRG